jgi:hypothetical protein
MELAQEAYRRGLIEDLLTSDFSEPDALRDAIAKIKSSWLGMPYSAHNPEAKLGNCSSLTVGASAS